jgi:hypothetical protein
VTIYQNFLASDLALAARLEAAEAANVAGMTQAASALSGQAVTQPFAGGLAIFTGVGAASTHAMGIGMRGPVSEQELEAMEEFFRSRGSSCLVDLCPMADASVVSFFQNRPYRVAEFNNVLARRIASSDSFAYPAELRRIDKGEERLWAGVVCEGFSENMPVSEEMIALLSAPCEMLRCWLAGAPQPLAGAAMGIQNGVALFFGDATLQRARRKGYQSALIAARLAEAQQQGCDLAMATVLPGSASHRNYERAGFQLLYMRINLVRDFS